ncbi:glycosyl transferase family group 2-domain-containing protein, partial [Alternaria rosae]|uniref:glycosyl transferase family group 2-domain-containing protein n=1 Tax=Alternaria rosae TaxID=1187941 RepID=UPI001E8DAD2D
AARDVKAEILANWLHTKQEERVWTFGAAGEGCFMKKSKGSYSCIPNALQTDGTGLYEAVTELNVRYVQIQSGLRLQVIPDFEALPYCQRGQSAAFVASRGMLVVWQDDPKLTLERAEFIINCLMRMMCGAEYGYDAQDLELEKSGKNLAIDMEDYDDSRDSGEATGEEARDMKLWQAAYCGMSILLLTVAIGSGYRQIAIEEFQAPKHWLRLLFIICLPAQVWLSLFFFQALVGNFAQIVGPTDQMKENSRYYSGKAPRRINRDTFGKSLPHVTIQMPVYKEGLRTVIEPTIRSLKQAISTYELQGGSANIFVNDDGMQILGAEESQERQEFYDEHGIGWVARPRHDPKGEHGSKPFIRPGKFKKASNMNYALRITCRVEEVMAQHPREESWSQFEENALYREVMESVMAEHEGEAWADGNIRIGDHILLVDSDTRVPKDCLLEAVSEMEQGQEVAILQYSSGVMNVTNNFFENGITFFTNMIYTMIRFAVAGGDVAPFVGHNAILRWEALQKVAYEVTERGQRFDKFWSEETVSEDFDMSLRLQSAGYIIRLASYQGDGFKEGVSLTVYDELARWEKYAYGCNELIFNPLVYWLTRGPFTKLFRKFIFSSMPLASKVTIMAYIGTYYALGCSWALTILNYFLIGFFNGWLDHYYINSFRVYFAIIIVFSVLGNIALAVLRYRIGEGSILGGLWTNIKWIPLLTIFLGGISLHVSQALLAHFVSWPLEWGSTSKETEQVSFFLAISRVLRKFKWSFIFCIGMTAIMITMAFALQEDWRIKELIAVWPMGTVVVFHFLLPIVLNPQLMNFTW